MEWLIVAVCLVLNALLAAAEIAFVSITRAQVRELMKTGKKSAQTLYELRENPERTLSVIQVGISLVGALAAAVGGVEATQSFTPYLQQHLHLGPQTARALAIAAIVIPLTFLTVIFGELVPKTLALRNPAFIAMASSRWLMTLDTIFLPVVDFLEWATRKILAVFFPKSRSTTMGAGHETVELDTLSSQARQYILNLVRLEKKRVRDVMLPWNQVDHIYFSQGISEVESLALRSGHTRLPVIADGQVFGIINTKELIALVKSGGDKWTQIVRPMSRVQEYDTLFKALRQMQEKRSHLSAVFAGTTLTGIVTMEDILEEVIGEIYDEDDDGALRRILSSAGRMRGNPGKP
ncbi:MAG: HlyC/CorC family transporter [Bdellovibrionales bacterium]|nr:HlyC/CorC family transporter [Bdellovibrionales bacterium]